MHHTDPHQAPPTHRLAMEHIRSHPGTSYEDATAAVMEQVAAHHRRKRAVRPATTYQQPRGSGGMQFGPVLGPTTYDRTGTADPHAEPVAYDRIMQLVREQHISYEQAEQQVLGERGGVATYDRTSSTVSAVGIEPWYHKSAVAFMHANPMTSYEKACDVVRTRAAKAKERADRLARERAERSEEKRRMLAARKAKRSR